MSFISRLYRYTSIFFVSIVAVIAFFVVTVWAVEIAIDSKAEFDDNATFENTTTSAANNWVEMDAAGLAAGNATYTSKIFDAGGQVTWDTFAWTSEVPSYKNLPDNKAVEDEYADGNIDMTGNVLLFHFDDDLTSDTSGEANDGVNQGGTVTTTGQLGNAAVFNGNLSHIEVADDASLDLTDAISMSLWFKTDYDGSAQGVLAKGPYTNAGGVNGTYVLNINGQDKLQCQLRSAGGATNAISVNSVNDGEWHHAFCTYDQADGNIYLYLDGELVDTEAFAGPLQANDHPLRIGTYYGDQWVFFGDIDEVAIWNRALSAEEIADVYMRGAAGLKFQVRSCLNDDCGDGEIFEGPDGTGDTYFSEQATSTTGTPAFTLTNVDDNHQYFQYQALFETASTSPYLSSVTINHGAVAANNAPVLTVNSVAQRTDGSGIADIEFVVSDADGDTSRVIALFYTDELCRDNETAVTFIEANAANSPDIATDGEVFQIYNIITAVDETVTATWNVAAALLNTEGNRCVLFLANDGEDSDAEFRQGIIAVDTKEPTVGALSVNTVTAQSVVLDFGATSTDANFDKYEIYYQVGNADAVDSAVDTEHNDPNLNDIEFNGFDTTSIHGLATGTLYSVNIFAEDTFGNRTSSPADLSFYTAAASAGQPSVENATTSTVDITLDIGTNPAAVTYAIYNTVAEQYVSAAGTLVNDPVYRASSTWGDAFTMSGLNPGTGYTFSVIARNGDDLDAATSTASAVIYTLAEAAGQPTVNNPTTTTLDLTIDTADNGTSTAYAIYNTVTEKYVNALGALVDDAVYQVSSTWGDAFTMSGLATNTAYTFTVTAQNADDIDAAASAASAEVYTAAAIPTNAATQVDSSSQITVTWESDGNPTTTEYHVDVNNGVVDDQEDWATTTTRVFDGLDASTEYTFTIKARNGDNVETDSVAVEGTTEAEAEEENNDNNNNDNNNDNGGGGGAIIAAPAVPVVISNNAAQNANGDASDGESNNGTNNRPVARTIPANQTDSRNIRIAFEEVAGVTQVALSEDEDFAGASYQAFARELPFTLSAGNGEKTVYVRLRNAQGGTGELALTITFDEEASLIDRVVDEVKDVVDAVIDRDSVDSEDNASSSNENDAAAGDQAQKDRAEAGADGCALTQGKAYKSVNSRAVYYITDNCTRQLFPNSERYFTYFDDWSETTIVSENALDQVGTDNANIAPIGKKQRLVNGSLIKSIENPQVYLVLGNKRHWIENAQDFESLGFDWMKIETVSNVLLDQYIDAVRITEENLFPEGTMFRDEADDAFYVVQKNGDQFRIEPKEEESEYALDRVPNFSKERFVSS